MKEWFGFVLSNKRILNFGFLFNFLLMTHTSTTGIAKHFDDHRGKALGLLRWAIQQDNSFYR